MIDCTHCFPFVQEVHEDPGQAPLSTSHPEGPVPPPVAPEPAPAAGSQAEKAIPSKSLLDWLRQQADDYSLDVPGFGAVSVCVLVPPDITVCFCQLGAIFEMEYVEGDQEDQGVWERSVSTENIM